MIKQSHRFHGYNSLRYVYQHGQVSRTTNLSVKSVVNARRQTYRLAVVVSKKVSKSAVVRNRIRRRIYELVRLNEARITKPYDIVITVFGEEFADLSAPKLEKTLNDLLGAAALFNKQAPKDSHVIVNKKEN